MGTFKGINTEEDLRRWLGHGAHVPADEGSSPRRKPKAFVEPGLSVEAGKLTLLVAVETVNEGNQRQWKARSRRAGEAWRAVRAAIGSNLCALEPFAKHLAAGGAVRATFTRLGGRQLDRLANLGTAFKGVEDALCFLLGVDDRSPQWHPTAEQEAGEFVGVRIELEIF